MFGALSQSVIGGGVVEAALRGGVVFVLSVEIMKWYRSRTAVSGTGLCFALL